MHTSQFKIPGYKGAVVVNHNSDWSGEAIINCQRAGVKGILPEGEMQEFRVPGQLLISLALPVAKQFVINETISKLEQIDIDK